MLVQVTFCSQVHFVSRSLVSQFCSQVTSSSSQFGKSGHFLFILSQVSFVVGFVVFFVVNHFCSLMLSQITFVVKSLC